MLASTIWDLWLLQYSTNSFSEEFSNQVDKLVGSGVDSSLQESHLLGALGLLALALLWEEEWVNVWKHTRLNDGSANHELVEFLIVSDGQLDVSGHNSGLFVVLSSISSQFKNFSAQIFQYSGQIDRCTSTDAFTVIAISQQTVNTTNWKLKSSSG